MSKGALQPCPPGGPPLAGAIGGMAFTGNLGGAGTVIPAPGTFVPVGNFVGPPPSGHPLWVLDPSLLFDIVLDPPGSPNEAVNQRLRYIGTRPLCASLDCALSVQEPLIGAVGFAGQLLQNGVAIPNSPMDSQTGGLITSADSLSFKGGTILNLNDLIAVEITNLTNTNSLIVSAGHLQVVGFFTS